MAFFRNTTVNLLNLHYGIHALALSGGGVFFGVYLLRAGVPAAGVRTALEAGILLSLLGVAAAFALLRRYYASEPMAQIT